MHEVSSPAFWRQRYNDGTTPWNLEQPAPPLVRALSCKGAPGSRSALGARLPERARVAVLGSGHGHDAVALARQGLDVVGYDFSPEAVDAATRLAGQAGVDARFEVRDIFTLPPDGGFDLIVEHTCFCAIHPSRRRDYVRVAHTILRPTGWFLGLFFPVHPDWRGGPPYGMTESEIESHFAPRFETLYADEPHDSVPPRQGLEYLVWMRPRSDQPNRDVT